MFRHECLERLLPGAGQGDLRTALLELGRRFAALNNALKEETRPATDQFGELRTDHQTCQDILRRH
ncbi:MAG: hypothetical protein FJ271_09040 [Planctomycetes bacterium]|nr:hypothetical protein [Planctomycetota bacterium]